MMLVLILNIIRFCRGIKYFRGDSYISNIFVLGDANISTYLNWWERNRGVQIFHDRCGPKSILQLVLTPLSVNELHIKKVHFL